MTSDVQDIPICPTSYPTTVPIEEGYPSSMYIIHCKEGNQTLTWYINYAYCQENRLDYSYESNTCLCISSLISQYATDIDNASCNFAFDIVFSIQIIVISIALVLNFCICCAYLKRNSLKSKHAPFQSSNRRYYELRNVWCA